MKTLLAVSLIAVHVLTSCSGQEQARELKHNRDLWAAQKIANYRYSFQQICFCQQEVTKPVVIEVRGGARSSITRPAGQPPQPEHFEGFDTVDKLFDVVQRAMDTKPDELSVTYDEQYGYPTRIKIDQRLNTSDDETTYIVSNFEVIK
jgi:hypothetical protein